MNTKALMVAFLPEQITVTAMWNDMVYHFCRSTA